MKSGAFDSTGDPRRGMLDALPAAMADGERRRKDKAQGQGGLFDQGGDGDDAHRAEVAAARVRPGDAAAPREGGPRPLRLGAPAARACARSCGPRST